MTNEKNFDEKFMELGEYYNIDSPGEVKEFLKSNEGIITLLNEAKPYLRKHSPMTDTALKWSMTPNA